MSGLCCFLVPRRIQAFLAECLRQMPSEVFSQLMPHEPYSKLLVSPLITPGSPPYNPLHYPFKEFRLWLTCTVPTYRTVLPFRGNAGQKVSKDPRGERKEGGVWEISTNVVEYILSKA